MEEKKHFTETIEDTILGVVDYVRPMTNTIKDIALANEFISPVIKLNENIKINKINEFFKNIEENTNENIIDFTKNLKDNEKGIFIEMINKVISLDDSIQNYIISILLKSFKENEELNYQEKSLYYNVSQLNEDDFKIYYCYIKKNVIENNYNSDLVTSNITKILFPVKYTLKNKELIEVVLKKFIAFNILRDKSYVKADTNDSPNMYINFGLTSYSISFFNILEDYFTNKDISFCTKLLDEEVMKSSSVPITGF
ncbi:MAG: hypothetical protein DRG78_17135 [Epsilonproteobacteria bacterium]|nr:MAG: hypothetical protein DRG78_17135 [Campylobacterota bacterium]